MPRYIDADAYKKSLQESLELCREAMNEDIGEIGQECLKQAYLTFLECILRLNEQPTADFRKVVHGEWIDVNGDGSLLECGNCHERSCCKGNYCPNCGADMEIKKGEKDGI